MAKSFIKMCKILGINKSNNLKFFVNIALINYNSDISEFWCKKVNLQNKTNF